MKNFLTKIIRFLLGKSFWKHVLTFGSYLTVLVVLIFVLAQDVLSTVIGTIIGFILSGIFLYFTRILFSELEDQVKVSKDIKTLRDIYTEESYYKTVTLNGSSLHVLYNEVKVNVGQEFDADDDPDKRYELPGFVENNFVQLIDAHGRSAKGNCDTVRLDDIVLKDGVETFMLSRSTFYNHLVTNRAMDFMITEGVTIRNMFEYGPKIRPLGESELSNHLGINALVFLNDGTLLVPRRKNTSTISKNMITSSIAVRLAPPKDDEKTGKRVKISKQYLFHDNIIDSLTSRLKISEQDVKQLNADVRFLGIGQNIYEGGKPQMYFAVELDKNIDEYLDFSAKVAKQAGKIDIDKCIYLADYSSMKFVKEDKITFNYHKIIERKNKPRVQKIKSMTVGFEKSFACNIWHYETQKPFA